MFLPAVIFLCGYKYVYARSDRGTTDRCFGTAGNGNMSFYIFIFAPEIEI